MNCIGKILSLLKIQTTPLLGWLHTDFLPVIPNLEATSFIQSFKWKVFGMKQR